MCDHVDPKKIPAVLRRANDEQGATISIITNEQRQADTPLVRAKKLSRLLAMGKTDDECRSIFGVSRPTYASLKALLDCDTEVQVAVDDRRLPLKTAKELSKLPREEQRKQLSKLTGEGAPEGKERQGAAEKAAAEHNRPRCHAGAVAQRAGEACASVRRARPGSRRYRR